MVSGLSEPWAVGFLPDGGVLITERGGRLRHVRGGSAQLVSGLPEIRDQGQGGLLDVMVPRDFAATREIFLSFAKPQARGGSGTALASARLSEDGGRLENLRLLFEAEPVSSGGRHFGSRIVEARDGTIFLTIGERGNRMSAQDRTNHNGSVIRLNRDGGAPGDNPYVGHDRFQPEIWSYGHRNPQGAALDLEGRLLVNEHGAAGGDEVNLVTRGANYGWPVIAYGRHYTGGQIGEGTAKPGMEQPLHYWDPSIAPSGMMVYSGKLWPEWQGDVFVRSLKFDLISRLESGSAGLREVERIESEETWRVRDVREAPDGSIWFLSVGQGALYRMTPK
jgi:glucose/arabinose dehydrogenase